MADKNGINVEHNKGLLDSTAMQNRQDLVAIYLSAAQRGDVNVLRQLLGDGNKGSSFISLLTASDENGSTALHLAADNGQLAAIRYIVEMNIDIDLRDNNAMNAMQRAAKFGQLEVVKYFVNEKEVSSNVKDSLGMSALSWAASCGHLRVVEFLVQHGCDLNVLDKNNMTPLLHALDTNKWDVFKYLVVHGADPNVGKSVLFSLLQMEEWEMVKYLLSMGINVNVLDDNNKTPLQYVIEFKKWDIAMYMIKKGAQLNTLNHEQKNEVLKNIVDSRDYYKSFTYAMHLGNLELFDMVIDKFNNDFNNDNQVAIKLENILAEAYEELKVKNIPLTPNMEYYIEDKLIGLRFFSANNEVNKEIVKPKLDTIRNRINMVIEQIQMLNNQYSDTEADDIDIDSKFFLVGMYLTQNIHVLKRQLRSTYYELPWEEIEFFLSTFLSTYEQTKKFDYIYQMILDKDMLLTYLKHFREGLTKVKNKLQEDDIGNKFPPKLNNNLSARQEAESSVISKCPPFEQLYWDYKLIRDIHSLKQIESYIKLALSTNLEDESSRLVIERTLQVIGESLKNTLESPNVSDEIHQMLLYSAPKNVREIMTVLRDSLSHVHTIKKRIYHEHNADVGYFENIKNDLRKIGFEITDILYKKNFETVTTFLHKITNSKSLKEVKKLCNRFSGFELERAQLDKGSTRELEKAAELIEELDNELKDMVGLENEQDLVRWIQDIVNSQKAKLAGTAQDFSYGVDAVRLTIGQINYNMLSDVESMKKIAQTFLQSVTPQIQIEARQEILNTLEEITSNIERKMEVNSKSDKIKLLLYNIKCTIQFEAYRIQSIKTFKTAIEGRETIATNAAVEKITAVLKEIKTNIGTKPYIKIFKETLKGRIKKYKAQQSLLSLFDKLHDGLVDKEDTQAIKKYNDLVTVLDIKSEKEKTLHRSYSNGDWLECKNIINNLGDKYAILMNSVKNSLINDKEIDLATTFKRFFSVKQLNKAIDKTLNTNQHQFQTYYKKRLLKLKQLLQTDSHSLRDDPIKIVKKYETSKQFQAAVDMLLLDLTDMLESNSLFGDNRFFLDMHSPLLVGKTLRNYLAHGDILYNILPHRPSNAIISHALVLVQEKHDLLTQKKMLIGKRVNEAFSNFHQKYVNQLKLVENKIGIFIGAKQGNIEKVSNCVETAMDIYSRDNKERTGLQYAAQGNDIPAVEYFLLHNLEVATRDRYGDNMLHISAIAKSYNILKYIIEENKININSLAAEKRTILHYIAENSDETDIVDYLIDKGATVDALDEDQWTPLHFSTVNGHSVIAKSLLTWGANANARDHIGTTPLHYATFHGHHGLVQVLLDAGALVDARDKDDWTPLHMNAVTGHSDITETLLKNGATVDARDLQDRTPLFIATFGGKLDVVVKLLDNGAKINTVNIEEMSPLHIAVQFGQTDVIRVLLQKGAQVNAINNLRESPLHLAAIGGHLDAVLMLLEYSSGGDLSHLEQHLPRQDLEIDMMDKDNCTPLFLAAKQGHTAIVTALLHNGANIEAQNNKDLTPLHIATYEGNEEVVEILLKAGANVNTQDTDGLTPLHSAAYIGEQNIVLLLLKNGIDVDTRDNDNFTPLHLAVKRGRGAVVQTLLDHGADINAYSKDLITPLHMAAKYGHVDAAVELLSRHAKVDALLTDSSSPLHTAAYYGHHKVAQLLMEAGGEVDGVNNKNMRPLHLAGQNGFPEVVEVLLKRKAEVDPPGEDMRTALHLAAQNGHQDVAMVLLEHGADVNRGDGRQSRPLHLAVEKGHKEVADTLLTYKADVNAVNVNQISPLLVAAFRGHANIVTMLLDNGATVNTPDKDKRTPLHFSAFANQKDTAKILLDSQCVVDPGDNDNMTPLHMAAQFGSKDVAKLLLEHSANVNAVDDDFNTALHFATEEGSLDVVQTLLESGAKVNAFNNEGLTPLHKSSSEGHVRVVESLLSKGAEVNALSKDNITPLHLAAEKGDKDTCRTLLKNGADFLSQNLYDTVLHRAVEGDNEEVLTMILQTMKEKLINDPHAMYKSINVYNAEYETPLMLATKQEKISATRLLLEYGADINAENNEGRTVLHFACENSNLQLVQIFIENNANINKKDMYGLSPIDLAIEIHNNTPEHEEGMLIVALLQRETNPNEHPKAESALGRQSDDKSKPYILDPIHIAALNGKLDAIQYFLNTGTDVNKRDEKSMTPLHFAAKNGHITIVNTLISYKASVDAKNVDNWTPLMFAVSNGHKDIVEVLLANKADVNVQDTMRLSPMHIASVTGHNDLLETLISNGAVVDIVNEDNVTPLHLASEVGLRETVNILLEHGANIEYPGKENMRALHYAAKKGHERVVEDLLDKGSNIEARATDGYTALHYAAVHGQDETVALLMRRGANIRARTSYNKRALHLVAATGRQQILIALLQHGADIDALDQGNRTPLYYAAANGENIVLQVLINRGANVNVQATDGMTPLHHATQNGFIDVVLSLLQSGALTNIRNVHQETAEDLARKNGNLEIINIFNIFSKNEASTEEVKILTENLAALQLELDNVGLKSVTDSSTDLGCSSPRREKRDVRHCADEETEHDFPYKPLEENIYHENTRMSKIYVHMAMAVLLENSSEFLRGYGPRQPIEAIMMYVRNIGDIISQKSFNQSLREKRILKNHYKNVRQFFKIIPKNRLLHQSMKSSYTTKNKHSVPHSWLFQSGPYSLSMFYDGKGFDIFSCELNYRHMFRTRENVTFEEMERFVAAFFKWRGDKHTYTTFELNKPLLETILQTLKDSPFWSPEKVAPDSVVMVKEHFGLIESLPAEDIQAMFYVNGRTPDMTALHPDFFHQYRGKITFRVEVLHKRIALLNVKQIQTMLKIIHKYNLPNDDTYLQKTSPEERVLLESYGKKVMHELRTAETMSSERLSELSWETLIDHLGSNVNISEDLKERVLATTKQIHTSATRAAWAKGMAIQTFFFLPDMIRAGNSGDITNLAHIGAMLAGDATVNTIYTSLINNLESVLSESRMKLLRALPVTSPIFKVLTIYSIVELTKQLQALPPQSEMRGIIEHKLGEQYATAGLMVAELLGFEVTPLWIGLIVEQIIFDADAFRKQTHLNIPFWEAILMSLGFEQSRLNTILEERQLVEMNLDAVNRVNKHATVPYCWVLVKHPRLGDFKWITITANQVPTEVKQRINSTRSGRVLTVAEDVTAFHGYRLVNKYKYKTFSAYSTVVGTRGKLIHSYWQKGVYPADPIHAQVDFSKHKNNADSFRNEDNIFLDQVQVDGMAYRRVPSIIGGHFLNGVDPVTRKITGAAVYVNKQTCTNPRAQSNFYLGFDAREGDFEVNFTGEGLEKIDRMNVVHNLEAGKGSMFQSHNATSVYTLTVHVGVRLYPATIEFSSQGGALSVSDSSGRVVSQYLVSGDTNYTVKDSTSATRIIFNANTLDQENKKTNLTCPTVNSIVGDDIEVKNWQCIKNKKNEIERIKVISTGYIQLSRSKKYLQMYLNDHLIDKEVKLFAKNVDIFDARGIAGGCSAIILGDDVNSFSVAMRGDITIRNRAVELQIKGTVSNDKSAVVFTKTSGNKILTLYNIMNNDLCQIINSMTRIDVNMLPQTTKCMFSTSELVYNFQNEMPNTNFLRFEGELDGKKSIFLVEQTSDKLSILGDDNKIDHIEVKHYSQKAVLDQGLILRRILDLGKLNSRAVDESYQLSTIIEGGGTVLYFTRSYSTFTKSLLEFESLDGHLVYHQFPSNNITVNDVQYLIKTHSVCVTDVKGDEIDGREILQSSYQTNQKVATITVDVCFTQSLQNSTIVVQNGFLIINGLILHHISDKTMVYFDKKPFPIRALKDSLFKGHTHVFRRGKHIKKRSSFNNYDMDTQEENTVDMNYLLSINLPEENSNSGFQKKVDNSEEDEEEDSNLKETTVNYSQAAPEDVTPPHHTTEVTPPFLHTNENTSPPHVTNSASSTQTSSINNIFKWMKNVSKYFTPYVPSLASYRQQNTWLRSDNTLTWAKIKTTNEHSRPFKNDVDLSLMDLNGTLALADLVIRHFTKQKPYSVHNQPMAFLEAQSCAVNITAAYENVLMELAQIKNVSFEDLEFNPVDLQTRVMAAVLSTEYSKLPEILTGGINHLKLHTRLNDPTNDLKDKIFEILSENLNRLMIARDPMVDLPRSAHGNSRTIKQAINKYNLYDPQLCARDSILVRNNRLL